MNYIINIQKKFIITVVREDRENKNLDYGPKNTNNNTICKTIIVLSKGKSTTAQQTPWIKALTMPVYFLTR